MKEIDKNTLDKYLTTPPNDNQVWYEQVIDKIQCSDADYEKYEAWFNEVLDKLVATFGYTNVTDTAKFVTSMFKDYKFFKEEESRIHDKDEYDEFHSNYP